jgi:hypothetical protein
MINVRRLVLLIPLLLLLLLGFLSAHGQEQAETRVRVAGITTEHRPNSHSDVQLGRLIQGFNLDDTGDQLRQLELVSFYTDQVPERDTSRALSEEYGFPIFDTVRETLTLGTGELAVDAVYLSLEHGDYPMSPSGNKEYPKRRIFEEVVQVFEESGRVVPVFMDKHLADNWEDAKWIYDTAMQMGIPLMAGSSLPVARRHPDINLPRGTIVQEMIGIFQGGIDGHSFHVLEFMQSFLERRAGGETGIRRIRALEGDEVWQAGRDGLYDGALLLAAMSRFGRVSPGYYTAGDLEHLVKTVNNPVVFLIEYVDGLRASVFALPGVSGDYTVAWRSNNPNEPIHAVLSDLQYARPFTHHGYLVQNVQEMFLTGEPVYPAERTLLVSGAVDAGLISLNLEDGAWIDTPYLEFAYDTDWEFEQPPRYPRDRTLEEDFPDQ